MQVSKALFQIRVKFPFPCKIYMKLACLENQSLVTEAWACTLINKITRCPIGGAAMCNSNARLKHVKPQGLEVMNSR